MNAKKIARRLEIKPDEIRASYRGAEETVSRMGRPTTAGPFISEQNALSITAVYRAVKLYADTIASLPFLPMKKDRNGGEEIAVNHWSYDLLNARPNPRMSAMSFFQAIMGHACTFGNGYGYIRWNATQTEAREIDLLDPRDIEAATDEDGQLIYRNTATGDRAFADDVIHIHGFGFDGVSGYSPITIARETLGSAVAKQEYESALFGNSAQAAGHIEIPTGMNPKQQAEFREGWQDVHQGTANAGKVGILVGGAKWVQTSFSPADSELLLSKNFSVAEVARLFSIPPHMLGLLDGATVGNMEEQSIQFMTYCLLPWLKSIRSEFEVKLFTASERRRYSFRYNLSSLLMASSAARVAYNKGMFGMGAKSINEVRKDEGLNPIKDEAGDFYWIPTNNLTPAHLVGKEPTQPAVNVPAVPDPGDPDDGLPSKPETGPATGDDPAPDAE